MERKPGKIVKQKFRCVCCLHETSIVWSRCILALSRSPLSNVPSIADKRSAGHDEVFEGGDLTYSVGL